MKVNRRAVPRVLFLFVLAAYNAVDRPAAANAAQAEQYCYWVNPPGIWNCDPGCPPTGCNCDCAANCYGYPC